MSSLLHRHNIPGIILTIKSPWKNKIYFLLPTARTIAASLYIPWKVYNAYLFTIWIKVWNCKTFQIYEDASMKHHHQHTSVSITGVTPGLPSIQHINCVMSWMHMSSLINVDLANFYKRKVEHKHIGMMPLVIKFMA